MDTIIKKIMDFKEKDIPDYEPHLMLGGGYPINAIVISDDIKGVEMNGIDLHTFGNNQVSQVAALKQIEVIERDNILDNVKAVGVYIRDNLISMQKAWPQMGEIRPLGFHIGIDLVKDRETREPDYAGCSAIRDKGFENGIIFGVGGSGKGKNVLKIKPPLTTTRQQADDILEKFKIILKQVYS